MELTNIVLLGLYVVSLFSSTALAIYLSDKITSGKN